MSAFILSALSTFLMHLLGAAFTEKFVAAVFFDFAEWLAKQSGNGIDDELVQKLKDAYENKT